MLNLFAGRGTSCRLTSADDKRRQLGRWSYGCVSNIRTSSVRRRCHARTLLAEVVDSGVTKGGGWGSWPQAQQARGAKQPGQKCFTTNNHKSEFGNVCWMSKSSLSQQILAIFVANCLGVIATQLRLGNHGGIVDLTELGLFVVLVSDQRGDFLGDTSVRGPHSMRQTS